MSQVRVRVLECGDAFGSGGRFQSCFMVVSEVGACLLDCGATALVAMRRCAVDPASIDAISSAICTAIISLVCLSCCWNSVSSRRHRPLAIAGPAGTEQWVMAALKVFFPGSTDLAWGFSLTFSELKARRTARFGRFAVTHYVVSHPSGSEAFAFRLQAGNRLIGYSGDTAWVDTLLEVARDADLFITECYAFDDSPPHHLNYNVLRGHLAEMNSERVLLTHMGQERRCSAESTRYLSKSLRTAS